MTLTTLRAALAGVLLAAPASAAPDHVALIAPLVESGLRDEIATGPVIEAVRRQNRRHAAITAAEIDRLDRRWRAEIEAGGGPLVDATLANDVSERLRAAQAARGGLIAEVFVMDAQGLVVGESDRTSDYWQGDEAKFRKTFRVGPEAVFVDGIEFDESSQVLQSQVSFTLTDPETGEPIGAATVGVDLEALVQ